VENGKGRNGKWGLEKSLNRVPQPGVAREILYSTSTRGSKSIIPQGGD